MGISFENELKLDYVTNKTETSFSLTKVQLFWEGHKQLHNLPYGFDIYLAIVKTVRQIAQIFVAFSEKLNFTRGYAILRAQEWLLNLDYLCSI